MYIVNVSIIWLIQIIQNPVKPVYKMPNTYQDHCLSLCRQVIEVPEHTFFLLERDK